MRPSLRPFVRPFLSGVMLAGVLLLVIVGTLRVADWTADRLLTEDAARQGQTFARAIEARLGGREMPDADALAEAAAAAAREASQDAALVAYRLHDAAGRVIMEATAPPDARPLALGAGPRLLREGSPVVLPPAVTEEGRSVSRVLAPLVGRRLIAEAWVDQTVQRARTEHSLWLAATAVALLSALGFSVPLFALLIRARGETAASQAARHNAGHDPMTGLRNRVRFLEELDLAASGQRARDGRLAVLLIDLDGLKEINEAVGHDRGDAVIVQVARLLSGLAGPTALVARIGGDEFAIVRPDLPARDGVEGLARAVVEGVGRLAAVPGRADLQVTARVGVACLPEDGDTGLRLVRGADLALDRARARREGGYVVFERQIESELQRRRDLEVRLRETLANDAFDLHFQPLIAAGTVRLAGFEALLRMPADAGGFVSPAVFVPIAEEIGLITPIGDWVVRRACKVAAAWPEHLTIAVNLSPAQFKEGGVHRTVSEALRQSGLAAHRLQLEITEGLLLSDDAAILDELKALKALGVHISMDDFGTGYSSLSYLWKFPFDKIKIDRSFMRAFEADDHNVANILQAIMSLSRALNMRVTAEGVETERQSEFLRSLGCDELQGFHFGRPMPLVDVAATILTDAQRDLAAAPLVGQATPRMVLAAG